MSVMDAMSEKDANYGYVINRIRKSETIDLLENANLNKKSGTL